MQKLMDAFIQRVDAEALPVEGIRVYQADSLVAEHRWTPDVPRNIYSHTKSYTATAVGIAIGEGLLALTDRPAEFFPEALPERPAMSLHAITLRDLLMMASGFGKSMLPSSERKQGVGAPDYARYVFGHPLMQPPGERFHYSNGDTYLAGRMVEARVGLPLYDYLQKKLFTPLGIEPPEWERDPQGRAFGAGGLCLTLDDMMKLGRLYLMNGMWEGQQLVPAEWVQEATAKQIDTPESAENPWSVGYGYQFWRSPYPQAYRADGMYGQITTVLPEADTVVGMQCAESDRFDAVRTALDETVLSRL